MRSRMLLVAALLSGAWVAHAGETRLITAEDWSRPRRGQALIELPALADSVRALTAGADRRLQIRYPAGEEGLIWAEELRGWLVALGVASTRIALSPGSDRPDALEITVDGEPGR